MAYGKLYGMFVRTVHFTRIVTNLSSVVLGVLSSRINQHLAAEEPELDEQNTGGGAGGAGAGLRHEHVQY